MKVFVLVVASDWDDDRCHVDAKMFPNIDAARIAMKKEFDNALELVDEDHFAELREDGYFVCLDEEEPGMGWEKAVIHQFCID